MYICKGVSQTSIGSTANLGLIKSDLISSRILAGIVGFDFPLSLGDVVEVVFESTLFDATSESHYRGTLAILGWFPSEQPKWRKEKGDS